MCRFYDAYCMVVGIDSMSVAPCANVQKSFSCRFRSACRSSFGRSARPDECLGRALDIYLLGPLPNGQVSLMILFQLVGIPATAHSVEAASQIG